MNLKVSVIIPFYNRVDWLFDAVESVFNQDYDNFEIIVVNDGSSENVDSFLQKYGTKIIYKYKENGGPASARNMALKIASGEFIAFLDSDDVWLPEKTTKQIAFMKQCGAIWSHTGYFNWFPDSNKTVLKHNSDDYGDVYLKSFISLRANTPAIMVRKECFDLHPDFVFPEEMRFAQDSYLWSKIAEYYPLALIEEPLIKVRQRGTNADLSSIIRFSSKSQMHKSMKRDFVKSLPPIISTIYQMYYLGNIILTKLKKSGALKKTQIEYIGRVLWILPFSIERLFLFFLKKYRIPEYKLAKNFVDD